MAGTVKVIADGEGSLPEPYTQYHPQTLNASKTVHLGTWTAHDGLRYLCGGGSSNRTQGDAYIAPGAVVGLCRKCVAQVTVPK